MTVTTAQIKELREKTGAGIMDCRDTLEEANGDMDKAVELLMEKGLSTVEERGDRETREGMVEVYSHGGGRVGVLVEVNCETDFVARSELFRTFVHEIALQIAASSPLYVTPEDIPEEVLEAERESARNWAIEEGKPEKILDRIVEGRIKKFVDDNCLYRQPYIRDDEVTVEQLLFRNIAAIGENVVIRRFERYELGEETAE
jgi:elongation factor Ts